MENHGGEIMYDINVNKETGIHFGVISIHSVAPEILNDFQPVYPEIGDIERFPWNDYTAKEKFEELTEEEKESIYEKLIEEFEPWQWYFKNEDYFLHYDDSGFGLWVEKSPYVNRVNPCSPCAPNAGDLDSPSSNGILTYALPEEFLNEYTLSEKERQNLAGKLKGGN